MGVGRGDKPPWLLKLLFSCQIFSKKFFLSFEWLKNFATFRHLCKIFLATFGKSPVGPSLKKSFQRPRSNFPAYLALVQLLSNPILSK